ncbi:MAG: transposase [Phycisphaeraceae bacterium]|nr:transposase [Phycisphaeraceae bacterium]
MAVNERINQIAAALMKQAVKQYEATGQKKRRFLCFAYQVESWDRSCAVVAKAECHAQGTNPRRIVIERPGETIVSAADGQRQNGDDIRRGESDQRMDELKNGLLMDRLIRITINPRAILTISPRLCRGYPRAKPGANRRMDAQVTYGIRISCHRVVANFFRFLPHTAAYNLFNAARRHHRLPRALRRSQPCTWRPHLIKAAAVVIQTTRRASSDKTTGSRRINPRARAWRCSYTPTGGGFL